MKSKADVKRDENGGVSALWRTNLYVGTVILRKMRQKSRCATCVLKRFTEICREEGFFFSGLSIKAKEDESDQTAILACSQDQSN